MARLVNSQPRLRIVTSRAFPKKLYSLSTRPVKGHDFERLRKNSENPPFHTVIPQSAGGTAMATRNRRRTEGSAFCEELRTTDPPRRKTIVFNNAFSRVRREG